MDRAVRHKKSLEERIDETIHRLKNQLSKIEAITARMERYEKGLFEKYVEAQAEGYEVRAKLYANECAEVRKIMELLLKSRFALEHALLRLETIEESRDVIAVVPPIAGVITALRKQLGGIVPEVSYELGRIGDELSKIVVEVGEASGQRWNLEPISDEAQKILAEASVLAEQKLKERLPELPEVMQR